ncbi:MAG: phosphoribosylglycinamide formyltransferase [Armatimonadetes bacterium]|nr:phosphoribosylglycinamide formyltransferase [Armatimonadota bacterium]
MEGSRGVTRKAGLVVLLSGKGSNLQALIEGCRAGRLFADIVLVVSNRPDAEGLIKAQIAGIPHRVLTFRKSLQSREEYDQDLARLVGSVQPDLVILAGFMQILTSFFLNSFPERVINLHPALLPEDPESDGIVLPDGTVSPVFRGAHAIRLALDAGVSHAGCTVHLVTEKVDCGQVIASSLVRIKPGDTEDSLRERIQKEEHRILPMAVQTFLQSLSQPAGAPRL